MKKIWKIFWITLLILVVWILLIDMLRVAWCHEPFIKVKTSCDYEDQSNNSVYKVSGIGCEYIEDSNGADNIWSILGKVLRIKACDIPAWNLTSCTEDKTVVKIINPIIQDALSEMNILKTWNNSYYNKDLNQVKKLTIHLPKNSIKELDLSELKSLENLKRLIIAWKYEFKQTRDWSRVSQWSTNWDWFVNIKWLEQLSWVTSLLMHEFPLETLDWKILPPNLKSFEFSSMGIDNLDNECDLLKIKSINIEIDWTFYDNSNLCICNDKWKSEEDNNPDNRIDWSTWNIINWKVDENLLTNKPNHIYFDITWDNTLYYIDEFWLSFSLWKEWKGWTIENAYEWKYLTSVWIRNEWLKTYWIFIIDNLTYQRVKDWLSSDWDEYIWNNNQYTFQRRIVDNWSKLWEVNLNFYDVEESYIKEQKWNINSGFLEFEWYIKECEEQIDSSRIPNVDSNAKNISYLRLNKVNVWNSYKISWTVTYESNGKFNKKDINCILMSWDYSTFWNTIMYNAIGEMKTKSEEEQKCIKSLEKYPIEQMKWDRNTVINVTCFPKDYFWPWFITWYVYTTKYSDLWLRITTPAWWRMWEPDWIFLTKSDKPIFVRKWNRISYFHPTVWEEMEYIEVYEKSKNESLEDIIKNKHLNEWCKVGKDIINYYHQNRVVAPYPWIEIFEPIWMSWGWWEWCIADNESQIDNGRIPRFFESPDKSKYYKLSMMDWCAPWPCSIFWKIEVL